VRKILGTIVDGFDSIAWLEGEQIPLTRDWWTVDQVSDKKQFALQSYTGLYGNNTYRLAAIDPAREILIEDETEEAEVEEPQIDMWSETFAIVIATTKDEEQATGLFEILKKLEQSPKFEFDSVWRALCANK